MKLYTGLDVLTTCGRHTERLRFVTPEIAHNADEMAERLNALLMLFGEYRELTSGFRDPKSNADQGGAPGSWHMLALAGDLADKGRGVERFIADEHALEACGLWAESPDEKTRTHVQCRPYRTWKPGMTRIFRG